MSAACVDMHLDQQFMSPKFVLHILRVDALNGQGSSWQPSNFFLS